MALSPFANFFLVVLLGCIVIFVYACVAVYRSGLGFTKRGHMPRDTSLDWLP